MDSHISLHAELWLYDLQTPPGSSAGRTGAVARQCPSERRNVSHPDRHPGTHHGDHRICREPSNVAPVVRVPAHASYFGDVGHDGDRGDIFVLRYSGQNALTAHVNLGSHRVRGRSVVM